MEKALNPIKILHLHEMESTDCILSCKGCYLTRDRLEKGNLDKNTFLSLLTKETILTKALYLNALARNINQMLVDSALSAEISNIVGKPFIENVLVTDSISAMRINGTLLKENGFTDVLISPRTIGSMQHSIHNLLETFGKCSVLYTLGIDNPALLPKAIESGCTAIELNIIKPYSMKQFCMFEEISSYTMQICSSRNVEFRRNTCLDFIQSKKDCSNPEDGEWEITTILGRDDFYSCAYTSNKCIARMTD